MSLTRWSLVGALAACSKAPEKPVFNVDTSKWQVTPLPAELATPGTLLLPPGSRFEIFPDVEHPGKKLTMGNIALPDGVVVGINERAANDTRDGQQTHDIVRIAGRLLVEHRTPTSWVFIYERGDERILTVTSSNFTAEPGINCSNGAPLKPLTLAGAHEIGAVCASLARK
jgi:hypothetical protein